MSLNFINHKCPDGNSGLKLGVFTFSEQDLVIPAGGAALSVIRTYNSMNPNAGDFGYSWTYALQELNVAFHEDRGTVYLDDGVFSMRVAGCRDVTLTGRELEVLGHVVRGRLNKQIAAALGIHVRTVKLHRTSLTRKLQIQSVAQLTRLVEEAGLFKADQAE